MLKNIFFSRDKKLSENCDLLNSHIIRKHTKPEYFDELENFSYMFYYNGIYTCMYVRDGY